MSLPGHPATPSPPPLPRVGRKLGHWRFLLTAVLVTSLAACYRTPPPPLFTDYPEPTQTAIAEPRTVELAKGSSAVVRADYQITAHVMSTKTYDDSMASIVPMDFALAWGLAATPEIQNALEVTQHGRWYRWRMSGSNLNNLSATSSATTIGHAMANVHIVPGSAAVFKQLTKVRHGDTVTLTGQLVDVNHPTGGWRQTSLSRTDAGAGSCEIILVETAEITPR